MRVCWIQTCPRRGMGIEMCVRRKMRTTAPACVMHQHALQPGKAHLLPDEVLQHRALPRTLAAHHGDLGQVQVRVLPDGGEGILHAVHLRNQILHSPVPHLYDAMASVYCLSRAGMDFLLMFPPSPISSFRGRFWTALTFLFAPSLTAPPRCVR